MERGDNRTRPRGDLVNSRGNQRRMRASQRTMERLKSNGILCGSVERWTPAPNHPAGGFRKDLFDCIDVLYLLPITHGSCRRPGGQTIGVQCGAMAQHKQHIDKVFHSSNLLAWLKAGNRFEVWSWGKRATKKQDGSKGADRWAVKVQEIALMSDGSLRLEYEEINPEI